MGAYYMKYYNIFDENKVKPRGKIRFAKQKMVTYIKKLFFCCNNSNTYISFF